VLKRSGRNKMQKAVPGEPKTTEKTRKILQKNVDRAAWLCYTSTYLSDERFLFARFFPRGRAFLSPIQGGNARTFHG